LDNLNDSICEENNEVKEFNQKIKLTQGYIRKIVINTEKLYKLKSNYSTAISEKEKSMSDEIDNLIEDSIINQKKANYVIEEIDKFIKDVNELNKVCNIYKVS
jgi:hypothetical protein